MENMALGMEEMEWVSLTAELYLNVNLGTGGRGTG